MKNQVLATFLVATICVIFTITGWGAVAPAFAESVDVTNYTNVLDDLSKDESFDASKYPEKPGDYGLEVTQIAESSDGELFVYVYQHSVDVLCKALSIRFSTSLGDNAVWKDYDLKLLNSHETLVKYLVLDFKVKKDIQRFYDVTQITRKYIEGYDDEALGGNTVNEQALKVAKLFTATTYEGVTSYTAEVQDVIELKELYTGNILYKEPPVGGIFDKQQNNFVSHYVAFSTDIRIDTLEEADVEFLTREWTYYDWSWDFLFSGIDRSKYVFEDKYTPNNVTVKATSENISGSGLIHHTYTLDRISSSDDFIKNTQAQVQLTNGVVRDLQKTQWVLCFTETTFHTFANGIRVHATGTEVSEVTVLRLKYWTNGEQYNLGVVSNKQTGHGYDNPDGWEAFVKSWNKFWNSVGNFFASYWWVFVVVIGVGLLGTFGWIFKPFGKALLIGLKWIGLGLYYVISAPARLIVLIANKIKQSTE